MILDKKVASVFGLLFCFFPFLFRIFLSFSCSCWPSSGLPVQEFLRTQNSYPTLAKCSWGKLCCCFHSNFIIWTYLKLNQFTQSLWSGYHWKDLFILQNLSLRDASFGQKWNKEQTSSGPVMAKTDVINGFICLILCLIIMSSRWPSFAS